METVALATLLGAMRSLQICGHETASVRPIRSNVAERVELAEDLWDSIVDSPDALPLTDAQKTELDTRLAAHASEPDKVSPWPEVRERLLRKRGS